MNVGVTFVVYHGRSSRPANPDDHPRSTTGSPAIPRTTPSGAPAPRSARSGPADRAGRGAACCRRTPVPRSNAGSIPGSRTPPRPSGRSSPTPRPATAPTGRGPAPPRPGRSCSPDTRGRRGSPAPASSRVTFGKAISINSAGYVAVSSIIALGVGNRCPFLRGVPAASADAARAGRTRRPSSEAARSPGGSSAGPATSPH